MDEAQSCEGCLCLDNRHIHLTISSIIMMIVIINDDSDNCGGDEAENGIKDEKGSEAQRWQIQWQWIQDIEDEDEFEAHQHNHGMQGEEPQEVSFF